MENPKMHREQVEDMLGKHAEQKQELEEKQTGEAKSLMGVAEEEAYKDSQRLQQLREEMASITGKKEKPVESEQGKEKSLESLKKDWQDFYKEAFGIEADFSKIEIPKKQEGFERLIIMEKGMTADQLFDKCQELFPSARYTDKNLDQVVTSDRGAAEKAYAIWVRESIEADEELKNLSAKDIKKKGIIAETLEERLLDEIKYFKQSGNHLDVKNVTLCAGSRGSDGNVPCVDWRGGKVLVYWFDRGERHDRMRARQAVS